MPSILEGLRARGFRAVTVSEVMRESSITLPQLREYLAMEQQFMPLVDEVYREIRSDPALLSRFSQDLLPWYGMYDLTVKQQIGLLYQSFGLMPFLLGAAGAVAAAARYSVWRR